MVDGGIRLSLEVFYSDASGKFTLNILERSSIPLEIVEKFLQQARELLPPAREGEDGSEAGEMSQS